MSVTAAAVVSAVSDVSLVRTIRQWTVQVATVVAPALCRRRLRRHSSALRRRHPLTLFGLRFLFRLVDFLQGGRGRIRKQTYSAAHHLNRTAATRQLIIACSSTVHGLCTDAPFADDRRWRGVGGQQHLLSPGR